MNITITTTNDPDRVTVFEDCGKATDVVIALNSLTENPREYLKHYRLGKHDPIKKGWAIEYYPLDGAPPSMVRIEGAVHSV